MTAPSTSPLHRPGHGLDRHALLTAATRLCGANRASAMLLRRMLKGLVARSDNWAAQARRLDRLGFSARHLAAPLRHALELPGDLALVQISGGAFLLLQRNAQRWQIIGENGESLADLPDPAGETFVEAVVLRTPLANLKIEGLASLAALWPALRAAWAEVGLASLLVNAGQLMLPLFSMLIYDKVVSNGVFETLWALVIGMILYLSTDAGMRLVRAWSTERIGDELTRRSDENLWHRLSAQVETPAGGFSRFLSNYRDLALSRDFVSSTYLLSLADTPFLALYLVVIGLIAWPLLIVAALLIALYATAGLLLQAHGNRLGREAEQRNTRKLTFIGDLLGALDVARTVPGAGTFLRRWRELSDASASIDGARRLSMNHLNTLSAAMQTFSTVAMLAAGAYLIEARMLSVGGLIACNLLASRAMGMVAALFMVAGKWQDFQRAAARMESSLEACADKDCVPRPATAGHIAVIGLGKHYPGRPAALEAVSFAVAPGERIALLGRPGAGKTTLLRSLAGLCRPDCGQILIDGLALEDIARLDRARWLAWKSQDAAVFAGSLEDNLRVAGGDEKRMAQAIWASGLEDELKSGRLTLGMQLEERGANLSGGQKQKVALARAFAQPCRILLLDEPTLGLDPDSERRLAERLPSLLEADTVLIMTTHSAIMLQLARRVIAMDGGRLVADGPREKLVSIG
jgi:ABC-type bacteriocin/lantibiotic exporter with double-glycine peptidase domain